MLKNHGQTRSPNTFLKYTNSFQATQTGCRILKYADDTVVIGMVTNSDETDYRNEIGSVVMWCKDNHLVLNATKTKEMVFDFRQRPSCVFSSEYKKCKCRTRMQLQVFRNCDR